MFDIKTIINQNIVITSVILFIIVYGIIIYSKPNIIFNKDGSLRQFGLGKSDTTVLPAWLVSLIIAILSSFIFSFVTVKFFLEYINKFSMNAIKIYI